MHLPAPSTPPLHRSRLHATAQRVSAGSVARNQVKAKRESAVRHLLYLGATPPPAPTRKGCMRVCSVLQCADMRHGSTQNSIKRIFQITGFEECTTHSDADSRPTRPCPCKCPHAPDGRARAEYLQEVLHAEHSPRRHDSARSVPCPTVH